MKEDQEGGKQKFSFRSVLTRRGIENAKKKAKKLKKLKNTIMASFQAKIVWKGQEREIIVSFNSYLTRYIEVQKNCKKFKN